MGSDFEDSYLTYPTTGRECKNCTVSAANGTSTKSEQLKKPKQNTVPPERKKRDSSLMTRTTFYAMLRDKLERWEKFLVRTVIQQWIDRYIQYPTGLATRLNPVCCAWSARRTTRSWARTTASWATLCTLYSRKIGCLYAPWKSK